MNVFHSTPASSVTAQTQLGVTYGIILNDSKWAVDIENTTIEDGSVALGKVTVVGFPTQGLNSAGKWVETTIGDTNGLVIVKFTPFTIGTDGDPRTRNLQLA